MLQIQVRCASNRNVALQNQLLLLFSRAAAVCLLADATVTAFDPPTVRQLLDELGEQGLARASLIELAPLLEHGADALDADTAERMAASVGRLADVLGATPLPQTQWPAMRRIMGDTALAQLVGIPESSLQRYADAERDTPQDVAERLHWVAMVVADLVGSYNELGIRRWFDRARAQLGNRSPQQALGREWPPYGAAACEVRRLAAALSGAQMVATRGLAGRSAFGTATQALRTNGDQ